MSKKVTALSTTQNKKHESISHLVTLINTRNESTNNNTDHEIKDSNEKNNNCNRSIEHAITATVLNNIFTTKCTLDIRPEKQNSVIDLSKVHQHIFEDIKQMDETIPITTQDNIRITKSNVFPIGKEHNTTFPDQRL